MDLFPTDMLFASGSARTASNSVQIVRTALHFKAGFSILLAGENDQNTSYICLSFDSGTVFIPTSTTFQGFSLTSHINHPLRYCNGTVICIKKKQGITLDILGNIVLEKPVSLGNIKSLITSSKSFFLVDKALPIMAKKVIESNTFKGSIKYNLLSDVFKLYDAKMLDIAGDIEAKDSGWNHRMLMSIWMQSSHYQRQVPVKRDVIMNLMSVKERTSLLTCKFCQKSFQFFSLKLLHYQSTHINKCFDNLKTEYLTINGPTAVASNLQQIVNWEAENCVPYIRRLKAWKCNQCSVRVYMNLLAALLHCDGHIPAVWHLFTCPGCCKVFRTPRGFVNHSCLNVSLVSRQPPSMKPHERRIMYEKLNSMNVGPKCVKCNKVFEFGIALMRHYSSNATCFGVYDIEQTEGDLRMLMPLTNFVSSGINITYPCELCGIAMSSFHGYIVHMDHHELPTSEDGNRTTTLSCKKCERLFDTPCSFYNHTCESSTDLFCIFCETIKYFMPTETMPEVRIVDVESLNPIMRPDLASLPYDVQVVQQPTTFSVNELTQLVDNDVEVIPPSSVASTSALVMTSDPKSRHHAGPSRKKKKIAKWKEYAIFNYRCNGCSKIVESSKLWKHLLESPCVIREFKPITDFNRLDVIVHRVDCHS